LKSTSHKEKGPANPLWVAKKKRSHWREMRREKDWLTQNCATNIQMLWGEVKMKSIKAC